MGEVHRAFDTETNRVVALKVLPTVFADDPEFQERFRREADSAARLTDPHVIPIHNYGEIDGRLFVDMRLVEGRDLAKHLKEGPLSPARAVAITGQVAAALNSAHRAGMVHRDVKPSNVLMTDDDFAYLIDFGIARAADGTRLTSPGHPPGTWAYMAPERFVNDEPDPRVDIYALACVLFQCLTGRQPFTGDGLPQLYHAHTNTPVPRPSTLQRNIPTGFDPVIAKGMAKQPAHRHSTAIEFAGAARAALTTAPVVPTQVTQAVPQRPTPPPWQSAPRTPPQENPAPKLLTPPPVPRTPPPATPLFGSAPRPRTAAPPPQPPPPPQPFAPSRPQLQAARPPQPGTPSPRAAAARPPGMPRNGLGTAAFVLGVIGVLSSFWIVGILPGLAAVIIGFPALDRADQRRADNRGVVKAALWLGFIAIALGMVSTFYWAGQST